MDQPSNQQSSTSNPPEPAWPAVTAVLAVGALYMALPPALSAGPGWLLLALVSAFLAPATIAHYLGHTAINVLLSHILAGIITIFMLWSLALLVTSLPTHAASPVPLLRSAACLWMTNVLVFATWYWRLDAGGPHQRALRPGHTTGAFLFPQMVAGERHNREEDGRPWSPRFIDYLFLAFNTSTALSPTDTPVRSRWAKALMMIQAMISLTIVVILIGRGVNIL